MKRFPGQKGQIVIPALFLFPTLMLFVFLIFETAKLSREKIRHQFAVDAAAFVEMTNYSDFLNRSAYVNGAFPMRIFREGFHETMLDCLGRDPCPGPRPLDDILYDDETYNGVFPRSLSDPAKVQFEDREKLWDIGYAGKRWGMNSESPDVHSSDCPKPDCVTIISKRTAQYWNINWNDAQQIYKLYVQIFQLLGSVEAAQYSVLKRLVKDHNFLRKSYWLNTGGPEALNEAALAVKSFGVSADGFPESVKFHCARHVFFHGNQLQANWAQPYIILASDPPPVMSGGIEECGGALFQLVTVNKSMISSMSPAAGGWPVEARWSINPERNSSYNYFKVDLDSLMMQLDDGPRVRASVSVGGFGSVPAVWPFPTPKYQVRLYP